MSVLLFSKHTTPRLQYIAAFVSETFFDNDLEVTNDANRFQHFEGIKINYSESELAPAALHIQPVALLFETQLAPQSIECFDWQGMKVFFRTGGDISFDIFAATFYLITRYEEYLPHAKDEFGRYAHTNSLAFREHFLHLPLVNMWWTTLLKILAAKHRLSLTPALPLQFVPTYDVDIAFRYKAKGWLRSVGAFAKDMGRGNRNAINKRVAVLTGNKKDPFDVFDWLHLLHKEHQLQPVFFFLLALKNNRYDRQNEVSSAAMKQLVQQEASRHSVGLHPSWQSNTSREVLQKEVQRLQHITGKPVTQSRQHYIKMALPHTYRQLCNAGIQHDYSMGYGSTNGFRASVASSFFWYDLEEEKTTLLRVHPFCFMDANAIFEQRQTPEETAQELERYYTVTRQVNGTFCTVFHNHFLSAEPEWSAWRNLYIAFLKNHF